MSPALVILSVFLLATIAAGRAVLGGGRSNARDESFYLADRRLGPSSLFLTLAATNFSAFTVLGLAGAGYRLGYVFYPVMGLGTAFMAVGLYLVGLPLSRSGAARGWVTPADFVQDRYGSTLLTKAYAANLVLFTLPYLALQPIAAGLLLESALGIPYGVGAVSVGAAIAAYTVIGGLRSVARTDVFHGILLFGVAAAAWAIVVHRLGGFAAAHRLVAERAPALLSRPGGGAGISPAAYLGYFLLWFLADPMFPQLNQRFLAARDGALLRKTLVAYPLVTTTLFFFTVSTGVLGAAALPGLGAAGADRIWPALAGEAGRGALGSVLTGILLLAPLAAIMTTMDSQLLTLSSLIVRDLAGVRNASRGVSRTAVAVLAAVGTGLALVPPRDILEFLNKSSFLGYAAMAPLFFGGLYSSRPGAAAALASIAIGEATVLLIGLGIVAIPGVPPIFVVAVSSWGTYLVLAAMTRRNGMPGAGRAARRDGGPRPAGYGESIYSGPFKPYRLGDVIPLRWALLFLAILVPAFDFPRWGTEGVRVAGLPLWVLTSAALGLLLSAALASFFRARPLGAT